MKSIRPSEAMNQDSGILNVPMAGSVLAFLPEDVLGQDHARGFAAQLPGALARPVNARQQPAEIVDGHVIAGDPDEMRAAR